MSRHVLSETHPMKPDRLQRTFELLDAYGVFGEPNVGLVAPRPATEEELLGFHTPEYIGAVQALNGGDPTVDARRFNFGPGDNPAYEGIYDAAALSTGASVVAAELVARGEADVAFNISGGLHHAMPGHASGFCVFDDPVIAINRLLAEDMRVAYVDIDCHHGDGVQHAFYDTDAVLTISTHESGAYLFPGTGFPNETGSGKGTGYSANVPLFPHTGDKVFLWAFRETVMPLLEAFRPDVLVTQLGIDTHFRDPITHLALTVQGFSEAVTAFASFGCRWLALGGGGYDIDAVVRAWTAAFAIMAGRELPDEVPGAVRDRHGIITLRDTDDLGKLERYIEDTQRFAKSSVEAVRRLVFPTHGLGGG